MTRVPPFANAELVGKIRSGVANGASAVAETDEANNCRASATTVAVTP